MTTITKAIDYIPRKHDLTESCGDERCRKMGHRVPLPASNFLEDREYLYVRDSIKTDTQTLHSRVTKWGGRSVDFRGDVAHRIQDIHNAILRALCANGAEGKPIDPTRVSIVLVDDGRTKIVADGQEVDTGDVPLLEEDEPIISSQGNTVHAAMLYLRDKVLYPTHASGKRVVPLSAVPSIPRSAAVVGGETPDVRSTRPKPIKKQAPVPVAPSSPPVAPSSPPVAPTVPPIGGGQPLPSRASTADPEIDESLFDTARSKKEEEVTPDLDAARGILAGTPSGTPRAATPREEDDGTASVLTDLESVETASVLSETEEVAEPAQEPRHWHGWQRDMFGAMSETKFQDRPVGWPEKVSFEQFMRGRVSAIQNAFMKLVDDPDCDDDDAKAVRRLLQAWFMKGYGIYNEKIRDRSIPFDEDVYRRFLTKRSLENNAESRKKYIQYESLVEWFSRLYFEGKNRDRLETAILNTPEQT